MVVESKFCNYYLAIIVLCVAAGFAANMLILSPEAIALLYAESHQYSRAEKKFEQLLAEGDHSGNVVIPLAKLYIHEGENKKAMGLLIKYKFNNKDVHDSQLLFRQICQKNIKPDEFLRVIESTPNVATADQTLRFLSLWYEDTLREDKQIKVFSILASHLEQEHNDLEYSKLVFYYSLNMKLDSAFLQVQPMAKKVNRKVKREVFYSSLSKLVKTEKYDQAFDLATKYLSTQRPYDLSDIEYVIELFINSGQIDLAGDISRRFLTKKDNRVLLKTYRYWMNMVDGNETVTLNVMKSDFYSGGLRSPRMIALAIPLALKNGESRWAQDLLKQMDQNLLKENIAMDYIFYALKNNDSTMAEILRSKVPSEYIRNNPCLKFLINCAIKKVSVKDTALLALKSNEIDESDRIELSYLMMHYNCLPESYSLIHGVPIINLLAFFNARELADLVVREGFPNRYLASCEREALQHVNERNGALLNFQFVLASVAGMPEYLIKYSADNKNIPLGTLLDAYSAACDYEQYGSAVIMAEVLLQGQKQDVFKFFLAQALVGDNKVDQAIQVLQKLPQNNRAMNGALLQAIARKINLGGGTHIPADVRHLAERKLQSILSAKDVTQTELKEAAACLAALGEKDKAEQIYLALWQKRQLKIKDIDAFVQICKRSPGPTVRSWFVKQAETGKYPKWQSLSWLNRLGLARETVNVVDSFYRQVKPGYLVEYLMALKELDENDKIEKALDRLNIEQLTQADLRTRIAITKFLADHGRIAWTREMLKSFTVHDLVDNLTPSDIAGIYVAANQEKDGLKLFSSYGRISIKAFYVVLYLEASTGEQKIVESWLRDDDGKMEQVLIDLYYFAARNKHNSLALNIAVKLYEHHKNEDNRFRLADALVVEKLYNQGLALIKDDVDKKNVKAFEIYLAAISGLNGEGRFDKSSAEGKRYLALCDYFLKVPDLSENMKVVLAYALMNTGFCDRAKNLFYELALKYPTIKNNYVKLYLYSTVMAPDRKDFKQIGKVVARVDNEDEKELLSMLDTYNMQGHIMELIKMRYGNDVPVRLYSIYLNSLLTCRQMNAYNQLVKKLPAPQMFNDEEKKDIFIALMYGGKEVEAKEYYDVLSKGGEQVQQDLVRQLGYYYLNNKDYENAATLFFNLVCSARNPESSDVGSLVNIPGIEKKKHVVDFLVREAKSSKGETQLKWLEYLNYLNDSKDVMDILKGYYAQ